MAKVNVHSASRDELVEAGVRAELADEILKLRRKGKISLEALDELPGVGPATLEQLRQALDFRGKAGNGSGNGGEPIRQDAAEVPARTAEEAREGERAVKETTVRTAEVARSAVRGGTEATQAAVSAGAETATRAARGGLQVVRQAADTAGEAQRLVVQRSAESTSALSQALLDLVQEQSRHNLETLTALTRAVRWDEILQAQSAFLQASLERMAAFSRRYAEVTQAVLTSASPAGRDRRDRAA
jgi:hypothetical protein